MTLQNSVPFRSLGCIAGLATSALWLVSWGQWQAKPHELGRVGNQVGKKKQIKDSTSSTSRPTHIPKINFKLCQMSKYLVLVHLDSSNCCLLFHSDPWAASLGLQLQRSGLSPGDSGKRSHMSWDLSGTKWEKKSRSKTLYK